jgi:hypothetical protein
VHIVTNTSQTNKLTVMVTSPGQPYHWTSHPVVLPMGIAMCACVYHSGGKNQTAE